MLRSLSPKVITIIVIIIIIKVVIELAVIFALRATGIDITRKTQTTSMGITTVFSLATTTKPHNIKHFALTQV